jgi:hypothetical protein
LLKHRVAFGTQTPPQFPPTRSIVPTHASLQVMAGPHCPLMLHIATCVSLVHSVVLGLHVPEQTPPMHAWFVQFIGVPHIADTQACTAEVPEHCTAPVVHEPEHAPIRHVELEQSTAAPHVPFGPQVSTPLSEHLVKVGVQTPVHAPLTHAWLVHVATGESETRSGPHCTTAVLLLHTLSPGLAPVQRGSIVAHVP